MKFEGQACLSCGSLCPSLSFCLSLSDALIYSHFTPLFSENIALTGEHFLNTFNEPLKRESCQLYSGSLASPVTCLLRLCYW